MNLIAWAGYVEDGSTDPKVDWVSGFEEETGCKVNVKLGNTSDEMVTLMRTGKYDGVSASGDATLRLIAGGDVDPVNTDLIPNYADVFEGLKDQPHNTVDGEGYGVPHGRGANLLMYNKDVVKPAPDSWAVVWGGEESQPYKGKITAYDSPIYIADAALYLKATQPDLGIENVYELDEEQFQAAVDLLKQQREVIGEYWSDYTKEQASFTSGDSVAGTTWQVIANLIQADKKSPPVEAILPKEGSTGWSDTWMISSEAKNPNCMYKWMDHIISPEANAAVAEWFGEAPGEREVVRADRGEEPLRDLPRRRRGVLRPDGLLDDADEGLRRRPRRGLHGLLRVGEGLDGDQGLAPGFELAAVARYLWRRPRLQLSLLLAGPVGWLLIAYLGSLAVLFVASLWQLDDFSGEIVRDPGFQNFKELIETPVYRDIVLRTVLIAALVTITDAILAFPIAFYMAKVASPRVRALLVVAVLMPLWSSYLVKVYAWRIMLQNEGVVNWALDPFGLTGPGFGNVATWLVFSYLWLPFMVLPIYAGLERIPNSMLDASGDLGGHPWMTFRRVVLPLALPAVVGRLDLHLLAHARRLHRADARLEHAVHRQRRLRERRHREQPAARRRVRDGAGGDHDRVPPDSAPSGRVRVAVRPG